MQTVNGTGYMTVKGTTMTDLVQATYDEAWCRSAEALQGILRQLDSVGVPRENPYHTSIRSLVWGLRCSPSSPLRPSPRLQQSEAPTSTGPGGDVERLGPLDPSLAISSIFSRAILGDGSSSLTAPVTPTVTTSRNPVSRRIVMACTSWWCRFASTLRRTNRKQSRWPCGQPLLHASKNAHYEG